jgi:hypothetical protein
MAPPRLRPLVGLLATVLIGSVAAAPAALTCVGNADNGKQYTAASGATYEVVCAVDFVGGDLGGVRADSLTACIDLCDASVSARHDGKLVLI